MKFSKYNLFIDINKKDKSLLVNTLTGATFKVNNDIKYNIESNLIDKIDNEKVKILKESGIIIEDNIDECKYIEYSYNKEKYSNDVLSLTLLLTYDCNLRCVYCYEGAGRIRKGSLTEDFRKNIYKFIVNQSKTRRSKIISLVLFGGEPLLNFNENLELLDKVKKYCFEKEIELYTSIVTNGILLNDKVIHNLKKYNCKLIQITLDGTKEIHDKRRIYENGQGSFDEVVDGIKLVKGDVNLPNPLIRINIDKSNIDNTKELLNLLVREGLGDCPIDFGIVKGGTDACASYSGHCFLDEEVGNVLEELWHELDRVGIPHKVSPIRRNMYCGLYKDSSYTITPKCEIYKCWEHVGEKEHLMGKINENGEIIDIEYAYIDWMTHNPIKIKECRECIYLPNCGGGCGAVSYEKNTTYHSKGCFRTKGVVEKEILYKFRDLI